jgi:hypothetical protein
MSRDRLVSPLEWVVLLAALGAAVGVAAVIAL